MSQSLKQPDTEKENQKRPYTLPRDPNRAMQDMMDTIDMLRSVYVHETHALENADTKTFVSLQDKKFAAAQQYQDGIRQLLSRKKEMKTVKPELKQQLESMQNEFSELATQNMEALKRMQRTMERLGGRIRSAARDEAQKQRAYSYSETGEINKDSKKAISTGITETA